MTALILASASPRRRELLATLGVAFRVLPAAIDESPPEILADPLAFARQLALAKARAIAPLHPDAAVLGADTIVVLDGRLLGKPEDAAEARVMLAALRGREHRVITGVAIVAPRGEWVVTAATRVWMRDYADAEIGASITSGEPFDKAGGYAIQDAVFAPVARINGCWCTVVGLPLAETRALLAVAGIALDGAAMALPAACRHCPRFATRRGDGPVTETIP